jgi:pyruvate dehydrogenase E2 component (dihydrolipoamide acetyltransferase)
MNQPIFPITMPKWGIEMQQGTIAQWHVAPGQQLQKGDALLDVETEKIVNSVEAPISGLLRKILAEQGAVENVGALIAVFAEASVTDEEVDAFVRNFKPPNTSFEPDAAGAPASPQPPSQTQTQEEGRISPIARRVAQRLGVDIAQVRGTGRNGRVSKEDVEAYAAQGGTAPVANAAAAATQSVDLVQPVRKKMSAMRATIAKRLLASTREIPHYRLAVEVDFTALIERRAALNTPAAPVSVNDLLVRATALALIAHPALNAQLDGDEILSGAHADISVAMATDNGLITPVVRSAEEKTPAVIGAEIRGFARRAQSNQLTREDIAGGTFTISNLGMYGIDRFDAIINPPQVGILAVGAATDRVIARNGQALIAKMATLTLSADHRVVDGAVAARFLAALKSLIEGPAAL